MERKNMAQPKKRRIININNLPPLQKRNEYNIKLSEKIQHLISYYTEDMLELENNIDAFEQALYDNDIENMHVFKDDIQNTLDGISYNLNRYKQSIIDNIKE